MFISDAWYPAIRREATPALHRKERVCMGSQADLFSGRSCATLHGLMHSAGIRRVRRDEDRILRSCPWGARRVSTTFDAGVYGRNFEVISTESWTPRPSRLPPATCPPRGRSGHERIPSVNKNGAVRLMCPPWQPLRAGRPASWKIAGAWVW
jgi:hypothetical protein